MNYNKIIKFIKFVIAFCVIFSCRLSAVEKFHEDSKDTIFNEFKEDIKTDLDRVKRHKSSSLEFYEDFHSLDLINIQSNLEAIEINQEEYKDFIDYLQEQLTVINGDNLINIIDTLRQLYLADLKQLSDYEKQLSKFLNTRLLLQRIEKCKQILSKLLKRLDEKKKNSFDMDLPFKDSTDKKSSDDVVSFSIVERYLNQMQVNYRKCKDLIEKKFYLKNPNDFILINNWIRLCLNDLKQLLHYEKKLSQSSENCLLLQRIENYKQNLQQSIKDLIECRT